MRYLITCGGFFARANAHFERISGIQILGPFWQDPGQMEHGGPRAIGTWGTQGNWNMGDPGQLEHGGPRAIGTWGRAPLSPPGGGEK